MPSPLSVSWTLAASASAASASEGASHYKVMSAEAYQRMMVQLLPPGILWRDGDSVVSRVLLAAGDELERISQRGADLIGESDPRAADELLADFEAELGLGSSGTDDERRARVVALLIRRQRYRPEDFQQALAPLLGQAAADVVVLEQSRAFAIAVGDDRQIYRFYIYRDPTDPGSYDLDAAQDLVDSMKPAHTQGLVIESIDFLCDDPYSLCDRDILGV